MGNIQKRPDGRWRARYRDAAKKEHSRHFLRKTDAERWLKEVATAQMTGQYVDPQRAKHTVEAMTKTWLDSHPDWSESTRLRNRGIVDNYIVPRGGPVKLADGP